MLTEYKMQTTGASQDCADKIWPSFYSLTLTCLSDVFNLSEVSNYALDPAVPGVADVKNRDFTLTSIKKLINKVLAKEA